MKTTTKPTATEIQTAIETAEKAIAEHKTARAALLLEPRGAARDRAMLALGRSPAVAKRAVEVLLDRAQDCGVEGEISADLDARLDAVIDWRESA